MFQKSGIPGTLVRYADDFVILLWRDGAKVIKQVESAGGGLGRLGLKLHPDKTSVVRAKDGFDFLGVHFRLSPVRKKKSKLKKYCFRSFDRTDQAANTRSSRAALQSVVGRVDRRTDTGNKGLEQLSQGDQTGAQATSQTQWVCPRTATNIPEAEIQ
jgi:hypothetical protein